MHFRLLVALFSLALCLSARAEAPRIPIWLFSKSGWIVGVAPDGSGALFRIKNPVVGLNIPKGYFLTYDNLYSALKSYPVGRSGFQYAFVDSDDVSYIDAPKLQAIEDSFKAADAFFSEKRISDFQSARATIPLLPKSQQTEQGAAANP
jgi:hypothetical protein